MVLSRRLLHLPTVALFFFSSLRQTFSTLCYPVLKYNLVISRNDRLSELKLLAGRIWLLYFYYVYVYVIAMFSLHVRLGTQLVLNVS